MAGHIFQTKPSIISIARFFIVRLLAVAAIVFAVISFSENNVFFSILILVSLMILLLAGPKRITLYEDYFKVSTQSILKDSPMNDRYIYAHLSEVSADIPNEVVEMVLTRTDPLTMEYRFVVMPLKETPKTFRIATDRKQLQKAIEIINLKIKEQNHSGDIAAT